MPYDFLLKDNVRQAVDDTLAPCAAQAKCKRLVDVGVGIKHQDRHGPPLLAGSK